jgi:hypothetical protein
VGSNATANTGSGGGGGGRNAGSGAVSNGGNGGSGVVVVKELSKASGMWNLKTHFTAQTAGACGASIWPKKLLTFTLNYLVVAGGGGGGNGTFSRNGGGGAGGYRATGYGPSPLRGSAISLSNITPGVTYPITIGAGGSASACGSNSVLGTPSAITSTGGGHGGPATINGEPGGSGGGGGSGHGCSIPNPNLYGTGGTGNTPPVSPPQGNAGGNGGAANNDGGGGGGGATAVGGPTFPGGGPGVGGDGAPNTINSCGTPFSITAFAGGGGGSNAPGSVRAGGCGGGGAGGNPSTAGVAGTANTGGGGGGAGSPTTGAAGGSGVVIVRAPGDVTLAASPCTNAVATHPGGDKLATFTVSGTLTVT